MKRRFFKKKPLVTLPPKFQLKPEYKEKVRIQSYLGKKGYTIPKVVLEAEDIVQIKETLLLKPFIAGPQYGGPQEETAFPVYRENTAKIYLPRFFGIERYGLPDRSEIECGRSIDCPFTKDLRDYQHNIINIYLDHVRKPMHNGPDPHCGFGGGAILEVPCGRGKTVMALKIISEIQKKTLILVHKEFLMNQWIERIAEFLPSARIGKIQGQTQDIEGKDIVIGMIQTMYNRDFPSEFFDPFGLTIIDEVHRIGSEEFSKTLFKTVTPNMLGISATVDRKDKLTKLLYMFIGPKIYSEDRKDDDIVQVRGIEFGSNDPEYSTMEYDFRGNPKYSTMITKICAFGPRSDFIVRILDDLLKENPENQIMVLAHNRSLLSYLFDAIQYKIGEQRGSVGFYIGGMKEKDLKITEGKRIVLATYAMAAEALDIKTLSTLVMATPKTDIEQSVGRILRAKHASPIVVDIIDSHDLFKNQWRSRKTFYKKCDYRILYTNSTKYGGFVRPLHPDGIEPIDLMKDTNWKVEYEPKKKEEVCHKEPIVAKCAIDIPAGFE